MTVSRDYVAVSADAHLETPPDLWAARLPQDLRDRGPRVVRLSDGGDGWALGDGEPLPLGLQVTGGQRYDQFVARGRTYTEDLPGTGGAAQRLAEQDLDGVDAEVLFSSVIATSLHRMEDPELIRQSVRAYNDWLSEYCAEAPERLFGIALIPTSGIADAVAELERLEGRTGIRGVQLLRFPAGGQYATVGDEPFWAGAEAQGRTIVAHHNFGGEEGGRFTPSPGTQEEKALTIEGGADLASFAWLLTCDLPVPTLPILTIEQLFLGGVLDVHPGLRFHFAETGIGWLPYWLEQMDDRYARHRRWSKVDLPRLPTQYVRDHFTFSFQEDHAGVALRHAIGVDNICWANDFPHSVSDWPFSRETRARQFQGLPDDERRRIEALNICTQLRVITPAEREAMAAGARPVADPEPVLARGARRI
jgi:predicted TIM-barrel fold metal-dependent hydrolase